MTLSTTASRVNYAGDGSTTVFSVPFLFLANGDITAVLREEGGAETTWVEATHYTLSGVTKPSGGTLTVKTSPTNYTPATGQTLVIRRVLAETQSTDYPEGGAFPASAHEQALDRLTMLVQQHSEELARSLHFPVSDATSIGSEIVNSATRANKVLAFDAGGDPTVSTNDLSTIEDSATNAAASATAAAASATAASSSASAAATSAGNAGTSETNAQDWATRTTDYVSGADNSAKSWALGGTGNGQPATGDAKSWATRAEDSLVDATEYSAKHYAAKAATSATAAANSAKTVFMIALGDETTAITTGTAVVTFRMPFAMTLTGIRASLTTVSSSGLPTFDVNEAGATILSTKLSVDANEKTSKTAATPAVIFDSALADDAEMTIDIDVAGTGAAGAKIYLIGDPA